MGPTSANRVLASDWGSNSCPDSTGARTGARIANARVLSALGRISIYRPPLEVSCVTDRQPQLSRLNSAQRGCVKTAAGALLQVHFIPDVMAMVVQYRLPTTRYHRTIIGSSEQVLG
eukprot:1104472-Pyramimonas_sp.AAC.4